MSKSYQEILKAQEDDHSAATGIVLTEIRDHLADIAAALGQVKNLSTSMVKGTSSLEMIQKTLADRLPKK